MGFTEENIIIILNKMPPRPQTVTNMAAHPDFMCVLQNPPIWREHQGLQQT